MTTQQHHAQFDWATELSDAQGHVTLSNQEAKEIGARLRSMGEKLKVYEALGDAADDMQLLRMGYAAARLEIESLQARIKTMAEDHADELMVAHLDGRMRAAQPAVAQQPSVTTWTPLPGTLPEPGKPVLLDIGEKYPIRAMWAAKHTLDVGMEDDAEFGEYDEATDTYYCPEGWYEWNEQEERHWFVDKTPVGWYELPTKTGTAQPAPTAQGDALSDDAVRVPLDSLHADAAYLLGRLREGSMPYARVIEIIRERIDAAKAAIRARAAQGDARSMLRIVADYSDWLDSKGRLTSFSTFVNEFGYEERDCKSVYEIVVLPCLAARAAQEGKSHDS